MIRTTALLLALLPLLACSSPETIEAAPPKRSPVSDDINERFLDPGLDPSDWLARWEVESREIYASRELVVDAIGLEPGDAIADVGAGTGLFVEPFSAAVGADGRVFAVDISPGFVLHLRRRVAEKDLGNVEVVLSSDTSARLEEESIDFAFVCDTYHHFEYHTAMLDSLRAALRPGGELVVIDFERIPGVTREWVMGHVRAGKEVFSREIQDAGFRLVEELAIPGFEENYFLRFARD